MLKTLPDTLPHLAFNTNLLRRYLYIGLQPINVDSNNTGRVFIGRGYQPVATVGHASQGEVLLSGACIEEIKAFEGDLRPYKGPIWVTSDTANQTIVLEERIEEVVV